MAPQPSARLHGAVNPPADTEVLWREIEARDRLFLVAGPCVIESEDLCMEVAARLRELSLPCIFKASYDKANRSSPDSFRGPGIDAGLEILERVRSRHGLPLLTDVHSVDEARRAGEVVDVIQIPAFLSRQTDLLRAAADTGRVINVKKGQFAAPQDMIHMARKLAGNPRLILTERGSSFGYRNLVADMRSIALMRELGHPVVFDATHSVQLPGAGGDRSGEEARFAPVLARAAVAAGADGLFVETHPDPRQALSDGPNMIPLDDLPRLVRQCLALRDALDSDSRIPEPAGME